MRFDRNGKQARSMGMRVCFPGLNPREPGGKKPTGSVLSESIPRWGVSPENGDLARAPMP